jgi:hypothetical protein
MGAHNLSKHDPPDAKRFWLTQERYRAADGELWVPSGAMCF